MTFRLAWLGIVLAMAGLPTTLHAYCVGYDKSWSGYRPDFYSVAQEFRRSDFVVEARVLRESWIGDDGKPKRLQPPFQDGASRPWGFDPYMGAFYTVQVTKSFKGHPPHTIRLFSENSTARFWLSKGGKLVAFVSREKFDPPIGWQWTIDTCGNSKESPYPRRMIRRILAARRKG